MAATAASKTLRPSPTCGAARARDGGGADPEARRLARSACQAAGERAVMPRPWDWGVHAWVRWLVTRNPPRLTSAGSSGALSEAPAKAWFAVRLRWGRPLGGLLFEGFWGVGRAGGCGAWRWEGTC
jgi:hypothetical protein